MKESHRLLLKMMPTKGWRLCCITVPRGGEMRWLWSSREAGNKPPSTPKLTGCLRGQWTKDCDWGVGVWAMMPGRGFWRYEVISQPFSEVRVSVQEGGNAPITKNGAQTLPPAHVAVGDGPWWSQGASPPTAYLLPTYVLLGPWCYLVLQAIQAIHQPLSPHGPSTASCPGQCCVRGGGRRRSGLSLTRVQDEPSGKGQGLRTLTCFNHF